MFVSTPACKEQDGPGAGDTYGCELFEWVLGIELQSSAGVAYAHIPPVQHKLY